MARGLAPDGRTKPGARVGWGAVAAGARALKEKAERSGASPCEFDYQVGRRGCLLLAIGPVREAQNPAASSRVLRASAVRSSTLYAIEDLRFTIYENLTPGHLGDYPFVPAHLIMVPAVATRQHGASRSGARQSRARQNSFQNGLRPRVTLH